MLFILFLLRKSVWFVNNPIPKPHCFINTQLHSEFKFTLSNSLFLLSILYIIFAFMLYINLIELPNYIYLYVLLIINIIILFYFYIKKTPNFFSLSSDFKDRLYISLIVFITFSFITKHFLIKLDLIYLIPLVSSISAMLVLSMVKYIQSGYTNRKELFIVAIFALILGYLFITYLPVLAMYTIESGILTTILGYELITNDKLVMNSNPTSGALFMDDNSRNNISTGNAQYNTTSSNQDVELVGSPITVPEGSQYITTRNGINYYAVYRLTVPREELAVGIHRIYDDDGTILGDYKQEINQERSHFLEIPLPDSNLNPEVRVDRMLNIFLREGQKRNPSYNLWVTHTFFGHNLWEIVSQQARDILGMKFEGRFRYTSRIANHFGKPVPIIQDSLPEYFNKKAKIGMYSYTGIGYLMIKHEGLCAIEGIGDNVAEKGKNKLKLIYIFLCPAKDHTNNLSFTVTIEILGCDQEMYEFLRTKLLHRTSLRSVENGLKFSQSNVQRIADHLYMSFSREYIRDPDNPANRITVVNLGNQLRIRFTDSPIITDAMRLNPNWSNDPSHPGHINNPLNRINPMNLYDPNNLNNPNDPNNPN